MNINYIILVHKNPDQVKKLVKRLSAKNCFFYIHVDKKTPIEPFLASLSQHANLFFIKNREDGNWGGLGIVKAVLNAFKQILQDTQTGYCVLLSGQDYPIKSNETIYNFLEKSNGCNFADTWAIPADHWYHGGRDRIHHYKFGLNDGFRNYVLIPPIFTKDFRVNWRINLKNAKRLLKQGKIPFCLIWKRNFPGYLKPFGGSQWFAITTEMAERILSFLNANKSYLAYHKYTLLADEIFFQSLIRHLTLLANNCLRPSLTYLRFEDNEAAHPVTFSIGELNELKETSKLFPGKLFARKFNPNDDMPDLIDFFIKENQ